MIEQWKDIIGNIKYSTSWKHIGPDTGKVKGE